MREVKTVQVGHKLIIANGQDPLRYVDLTTNKVHQYKPERNWKRPLLKLFKRQPTEGVMFYPKRDGFKMLAAQPNIQNILTTTLTNICVWYDGTMRPMRGHDGSCQWKFDGQIWSHL